MALLLEIEEHDCCTATPLFSEDLGDNGGYDMPLCGGAGAWIMGSVSDACVEACAAMGDVGSDWAGPYGICTVNVLGEFPLISCALLWYKKGSLVFSAN